MTIAETTEYTKALDRVTRLLALRDHSRLELQTKLSKQFNAELVEQVLADALARGWLAPEPDLAERAAALYRRALKSRRYIEGQLTKRGLPLPPPDDAAELTTIRILVERKFGSVAELKREEHNQVYRYLKYRGFEDRGIRQVLNEKP